MLVIKLKFLKWLIYHTTNNPKFLREECKKLSLNES